MVQWEILSVWHPLPQDIHISILHFSYSISEYHLHSCIAVKYYKRSVTTCKDLQSNAAEVFSLKNDMDLVTSSASYNLVLKKIIIITPANLSGLRKSKLHSLVCLFQQKWMPPRKWGIGPSPGHWIRLPAPQGQGMPSRHCHPPVPPCPSNKLQGWSCCASVWLLFPGLSHFHAGSGGRSLSRWVQSSTDLEVLLAPGWPFLRQQPCCPCSLEATFCTNLAIPISAYCFLGWHNRAIPHTAGV